MYYVWEVITHVFKTSTVPAIIQKFNRQGAQFALRPNAYVTTHLAGGAGNPPAAGPIAPLIHPNAKFIPHAAPRAGCRLRAAKWPSGKFAHHATVCVRADRRSAGRFLLLSEVHSLLFILQLLLGL